jgi:MoxR-like ATPase
MKIEIPARCDVSSLSAFIALSQVSRVPLLIWGHPGIGKTSIVQQYAEETGQHCEVIVGSCMSHQTLQGTFIWSLPTSMEGFSDIQFLNG